MKGSAFIKLATEADSAYVDIYTQYGVSFIKGSYMKLMSKAASKGYVTNESRLEHGVRIIAKAQYAKYASRTVSVDILMEAASEDAFNTRYENFTAKISQGLIFLKIPTKKRVFKLVYSNIKPKEEYKGNYGTFTIDLMEPNPNDRLVLT